MRLRRSSFLPVRFDVPDGRVKLASIVSALAMVLAGMVAAGTTPAAAATLNDLSGVRIVNGISVGTGADALVEGAPVTANYKYLLQKLNVGNPRDTLHNCLPPSNNGSYLDDGTGFDPQYPKHCAWPGTHEANTGDEIDYLRCHGLVYTRENVPRQGTFGDTGNCL